MLKFLIYLGVLWKAECVFFDLTDIDDPVSYFWNNRVTTEAKGTCTYRNSDGTEIQGKCTHAAKCFLSRGTPKGSCGFGSTCCIYGSGCNSETKEKVSYFSGSYKGITNSLQKSFCTHKVNLLSNTCQLRLDFESFLFDPPVSQTVGTTSTIRYTCSSDSLTVTPNHYYIPPLCGDNTNQHVYVHLNRTIDSTVVLQIFLGDRSSDTVFDVDNPEWNIKITQIECKTNLDVFHHNKKSIDDDLRLLAPLGVLQYFTETSGTFRTLGIKDTSGTTPRTLTADPYTYINNLRYAIAFKRYPNVCGVQFSTLYFVLQDGTTRLTTCTDFIFAPEAETTTTTTSFTNSKWCGTTAGTTTATSVYIHPPGPLYIYFSSPSTYTAVHTQTWGFNLNYNLVSCPASIS